MINVWILAGAVTGILVFVSLAWVFASWWERRRTGRFDAEQADIAEAERQERLDTWRRQHLIGPGNRADLWDTYEEKRYEDGAGDQ